MLSSPLPWVVMSVSFRWISCCCLLESLGHCTGVMLAWFSVSDPDTWDEISFIGDVCASTSLLCLNSCMWVFLWVSLVKTLWLLVTWVSWGCCQTASGIGGSVEWVTSGLSIAAPEWTRGILSFYFGLQPEYHSSHLDWLLLGPDFVFPVFCAREAVYWLQWLRSSIPLWNGLSCHMSHRMDK